MAAAAMASGPAKPVAVSGPVDSKAVSKRLQVSALTGTDYMSLIYINTLVSGFPYCVCSKNSCS